MKTQLKLAALALLLSTFNAQLSTCLAQGSLTPPGAPAPTMKTLDQVEARTAITNSTTGLTISQPGSYYLTRNLAVSSGDAITIATNGVTLDLNGFTISSTLASAAGYGIRINSGLSDIAIYNGHIRGGVTNNGSGVYSGSGLGYGINYSSTAPANVLVSRVSVSGCLYYGIYLGMSDSTVVEACTVRTTGNYGIRASTIINSSAIDCGGTSIYGYMVSACRGESSSGNGVYATTALNCYGDTSDGYGVYATTALNCYGSSSGGAAGLYASVAQNCYGSSSGGGTYGLYATAAQNCYGSTAGSSYGVAAYTAQNCYGSSSSGTGLYAYRAAIGCYGTSSTGTGLYARVANTCVGSRSGGTAIQATIGIGCYAEAGTNNIANKYNMP